MRVVIVDGGGPSMSHEANLNRLSDIAARGWDEQVALVDGRTATMRDDEYMVLRVIDGLPQGLPNSAGPSYEGLSRRPPPCLAARRRCLSPTQGRATRWIKNRQLTPVRLIRAML